MLFAWAIDDDDPVQIQDVTAGTKIPLKRRLALKNPDVLIYAHNSHFDRTVLNHTMPGVAAGGVERWRDTVVRSLAHGLPGLLGDLYDILSVSQDKAKDKAGKQLIQLFCKPRP
ncbi:DNA polymerase [Izhakiella capsodis]|uniref:DNA polymerase n=1 Tax=Izhakiella capsodis TaxID=1367852 RepID=A0A1I4X4W5_9GAMM|nr:DNA polymerase [Izhakiella capsodis]